MKLNNEQKARALQCFGKMLEYIEKDPDPKTQDKLTDEYNCVNCDSYQYCKQIADTLQGGINDNN